MKHSFLLILSASALAFAGPVFAQESEAPWSMADEYWGAEEMAEAREKVLAANGAQKNLMLMAERFELQAGEDEDTLLWDAQGWYGGDLNKLWIKTEGDISLDEDEIEEAELQVLYSRAVSSYWDLQAGLRQDFEPDGRTYGVVGFQGVAPYWFEIDAAAFLSDEGDLSARIEAEYELLLTQRLILQPRIEAEFSAKDDPERGLGSGITGLDAGARLRYEFSPAFAPYVGVEWQGALGETRNLLKAGGGDPDGTVFVLGVRSWF